MQKLSVNGDFLYISSFDISLSKGGAINEREFMCSLLKYRCDKTKVLIPYPAYPCNDIDTTQTTYFHNANGNRPHSYLIQQLDMMKKIKQIIHIYNIGFIIIRLTILSIGLVRILPYISIPYVIKTMGDPDSFVVGNSGAKRLLALSLRPLNRYLIHKIVRGALAVDCCTKELALLNSRLFNIPGEKLAVVGNATNTARFFPSDCEAARLRLGIERFSPVLGFVGSRPESRGGRQLLDLGRRLCGSFPNLAILIAGGEDEKLRALAVRLGIGERVFLPGRLPYSDVPSCIHAFDIGFAFDYPQRLQKIGNSHQKIRQYLACGVPVITSGADISASSNHKFVKSVGSNDLPAIEAAVRDFLSLDDEERNRIRNMAVEYARSHLSTDRSLVERISFWEKRLQASKDRLAF
jgi:glycosyltransferase involved in cell wall biosynthesis